MSGCCVCGCSEVLNELEMCLGCYYDYLESMESLEEECNGDN